MFNLQWLLGCKPIISQGRPVFMNWSGHFWWYFFLLILGDWLKKNVTCGNSSTGITGKLTKCRISIPIQMYQIQMCILINTQVIYIVISLITSVLKNKSLQSYNALKKLIYLKKKKAIQVKGHSYSSWTSLLYLQSQRSLITTPIHKTAMKSLSFDFPLFPVMTSFPLPLYPFSFLIVEKSDFRINVLFCFFP